MSVEIDLEDVLTDREGESTLERYCFHWKQDRKSAKGRGVCPECNDFGTIPTRAGEKILEFVEKFMKIERRTKPRPEDQDEGE